MSHEGNLTPEAQRILPDAVKRISGLYGGEIMQDALVEAGAIDALDPKRDTLWRISADLFPQFKNRIFGLKLALNNSRQAFGNEGDALKMVTGARFEEAEDMGVRHLLTTVLCSRATIAQGAVDHSIVLNTEAEAMKKELGIMRGITGLELQTMSFNRAIEAVLTGQLQLSRQTQLPIE